MRFADPHRLLHTGGGGAWRGKTTGAAGHFAFGLGAGATIPITSFGNSLVHGAMQEAEQHGLVGVITGMFEVTSSGISAAIIFGLIGAIIFKPKG